MPKMDGIEVLEHIMKLSDTPVVMISGHGTIETAVEAIKKGGIRLYFEAFGPEQAADHFEECYG